MKNNKEMTLSRMYEMAKSHIDLMCTRWENDLMAKYGLEIARERLKQCRDERQELINFKNNNFK